MARHRKLRTRPFSLESLERREVFAGNVNVSVNNGTLNIAGDSQGNQVEVHQTAVNWYKVTGLNGTTVNGKDSKLIRVTGGMNVNLNGGDDLFRMGGTVFFDDVDGALNVTMGAGKDKVELGLVSVDGATNIKTDAGDDEVRLTLGVYHALTIDTGADKDLVDAAVIAASSLKINTQAGDDRVELGFLKSDGVLDVKTGTENDTVELQEIQGSTALTIDTADGNDDVELQDRIVANSIGVKTGVGLDNVELVDLIAAGSLKIETQGDADKVTALGAEVGGLLTIDTADGDDVVSLNDVLAKGGLNLLTSTGADTVTLTDVAAPGKTITIDTGDTADAVKLNRVTADKLFANLGGGGDRIDLVDSVFNQTTIDGGAGADDFFDLGGNQFGVLVKNSI